MSASAISPDQIRALQATRRRAGIDDETWRERLKTRFKVASTKDLSADQAGALLDELRGGAGSAGKAAASDPRLQGPYAAKARALWISAWNLGISRNRTDAALLSFVERQTGFKTLAWVRQPRDGSRVVEALKAWLARAGGVDWSLWEDPKRAVLWAIIERIAAATGEVHDRIETSLAKRAGVPEGMVGTWLDRDLDALSRAGGDRLRKITAEPDGREAARIAPPSRQEASGLGPVVECRDRCPSDLAPGDFVSLDDGRWCVVVEAVDAGCLTVNRDLAAKYLNGRIYPRAVSVLAPLSAVMSYRRRNRDMKMEG